MFMLSLTLVGFQLSPLVLAWSSILAGNREFMLGTACQMNS